MGQQSRALTFLSEEQSLGPTSTEIHVHIHTVYVHKAKGF